MAILDSKKIMLIGLRGEQGPAGPQGPQGERGEKGDSGDIASQAILDEIVEAVVYNRAGVEYAKQEIENLYTLSNATVTGTEEVTQAYQSRQTANGLSGLIDGALTRVTKIQGDTVVVDGALKHASFYTIKSTGKNQVNIPDITLNGASAGGYDVDCKGDLVFNFSRATTEVLSPSGAIVSYTVDGVEKYITVNTVLPVLISGHLTRIAFPNYAKATGTLSKFQVEYGTSKNDKTAYEPYKEEIYGAIEPVGLPKWNYIDVENKKIVHGTKMITLDGTHGVSINNNKYTSKIIVTVSIPYTARNDTLICGDMPVLPLSSVESGGDTTNTIYGDNGKQGICRGVDGTLYVAILRENLETTDANGVKAFFAKNPVTICVQALTQTEEEFTTADLPEKYKSFAGGNETIKQHYYDAESYDNAGLKCTVTQTYAVIKGGAEE